MSFPGARKRSHAPAQFGPGKGLNCYEFVAIAPHLTKMEGHHYFYHDTLQQAVDGLGLNFHAWLPKTTEDIPLKKGWNTKLSLRGKTPKTQLLFFFLDLWRTLFFRRKKTVFFMDCCTLRALYFFTFLQLCFGRRKDRFILVFKAEANEDASVVKRCLALLKKRGVHLCVDNELTAEVFGLTQLFPVLFLPSHELESHISKDTQRIVCILHGQPKKTKGSEMIEILLNSAESATQFFEMRFCFDFAPSCERKKHVDNALSIRCFESGMPRQEYLAELLKSDIVLLPYDPIQYAIQSSGIFVEAIVCGKMVVVSDKTWLSYELRKYGLEALIVDWFHPQFFERLKVLYEDPSLKSKLKTMQEAYRTLHTVDRLKSKLRELLYAP